MKNVIVVPNCLKDPDFSVTEKLIRKLVDLGFEILIDQKYTAEQLSSVKKYSSSPEADLVIVVGGDGSIIDASRIATSMDIPLLGVNLGKVGYLAWVDPENLDELEKLTTGSYEVSEMMLLNVEKHGSEGIVELSDRYALNDVVICHDNYFGISEFKVDNGSDGVVEYRADGIIVSTPVGSTAYSLSAGGPIISHKLDCITVTPICPHSFFNRSIIYGPNDRISITNSDELPLNVIVDGRLFSKLRKGEKCIVCRSNKSFKMLRLGQSNVFSTLTKKI